MRLQNPEQAPYGCAIRGKHLDSKYQTSTSVLLRIALNMKHFIHVEIGAFKTFGDALTYFLNRKYRKRLLQLLLQSTQKYD